MLARDSRRLFNCLQVVWTLDSVFRVVRVTMFRIIVNPSAVCRTVALSLHFPIRYTLNPMLRLLFICHNPYQISVHHRTVRARYLLLC